MRLHLFILLLLTSLCFGVDFNAKTEENRAKIMEFSANHYTRDATFEKYKNNLWFKDEEFLRELLKNTYRYNLDDIMKCIDNKNILNDKEFMLNILELLGDALKHVSERLKDDKEVVFKAVDNNGNALKYASKRLKNDKEFIFKIAKKNTSILAYVNKSILKEKEIVLYYLNAVEKYNKRLKVLGVEGYKITIEHSKDGRHSIFKKISPHLLDDEEVMFKAVSVFGTFLQYASQRMKKDKNIAKKAVSTNGLALQYVDKTLQDDKQIIIAALKNNPKAHQYIPCKMRQDKDVLKILMNQNINGYMQNKIKRKVKPQAWECYDINETLERLYGKDRVYETSKDIDIKFPTDTMEYMSMQDRLSLITNKKVKSIAILQKKEGDRALVALYYPYGNTVNIALPLKILNASLTMMIEGMKVVVITEIENNHLFINEYTIKYGYACMNGYGMLDYLDDLKEILNKTGFKIKYQIDENRIGYLTFRIHSAMLNYDEAEKFNVDINFVSHIEGHIKDKKLFDLYTSEYVSKNPLIKMKFENMKQDEDIDFSYTTIDGKVTSKYIKPKKMKKKSH